MWVEYLPYSLDLAPSDYYLFPEMKERRGHRFASSDAVDHFWGPRWRLLHTEVVHMLHIHWTKCVDVGGNHVDQ